LNSYTIRLRILCLFSSSWLAFSFVIIAISFPHQFQFLVIFGELTGPLLGVAGILKGDWALGKIALCVGSLLFLLSTLFHIVLGNLVENLPTLLLAFVALLFLVEIITLVCEQNKFSSKGAKPLDNTISIPSLNLSMNRVFSKLSRFGFIFASSYIITILLLYLGGYVASLAPVLSDISLYIVIVSAALALLLVFQEESSR
jgi:hypothetical protein